MIRDAGLLNLSGFGSGVSYFLTAKSRKDPEVSQCQYNLTNSCDVLDMYICVCIYVYYVYIYIYIYMYIYIYIYLYTSLSLYIYIYTYTYVCVYPLELHPPPLRSQTRGLFTRASDKD